MATNASQSDLKTPAAQEMATIVLKLLATNDQNSVNLQIKKILEHITLLDVKMIYNDQV